MKRIEYIHGRSNVAVEAQQMGEFIKLRVWIDGNCQVVAHSCTSEEDAIAYGKQWVGTHIDHPAAVSSKQEEEVFNLFDSGKEHRRGDPACSGCDEGFPQAHEDSVMRAYGKHCGGLMHRETGEFVGATKSIADVLHECDECHESL